VYLVGFIKKKFVTTHGHTNVKFANAKQAKEAYQYRNTKEKLYKTTQQYGIIKFAEKNSLHSNTYASK